MKKGKNSYFTVIALLIFGLFYAISVKSAQVEVQLGFYDQYKNYLKDLPAPTVFEGATFSDLLPVTAFYQAPFSILKIDLNGNDKISYLPGDKVNILANLSYQYAGNENIQKIKNACTTVLKDENKCKMPEVRKIPEFNNLGVYVQVWRKDDSNEGSSKGDYLVDEFYALENQSLANGENKNFSINWTVPENQRGGNYYFSLYLNQNKSFDLKGTPLAVFSEADKFSFEVKNEKIEGIEINKNNIKINNTDYAYRKPAPTVKGNEVKITLPISNSGKEPRKTTVKYELYRFGQTNPADLIESKTEDKTISAGATDALNYSFVPNDSDSVYDLKIFADTSVSKSSAYIRFAIEGKDRGIFRSLNFAEDNGVLVPMFCVRNANWIGEFLGKVKLTLGDAVWEKEGKIPAGEGNCFLVRNDKFKLAGTKCAQLKGEIINQNGKTVDLKETSVNCQPRKQTSLTSLERISGSGWAGWLFYGLIGLVVVVITAIGISIYLNNKKSK